MKNYRRDFLRKGALLGLSGFAGSFIGKENLQHAEKLTERLGGIDKFNLPSLSYAYDALEPFIDKETMLIHHTKHHQGYVDKLNKAIENYKGSIYLPDLFKSISTLDLAIRNNAGGHYNHSLFWALMKPNNPVQRNEPVGKLYEAIKMKFKHPDAFKNEFTEKAMKIFGSGWCWLIFKDNELKITTTANQDNPLMDVAPEQGVPILALDVWEHAYYLKYQNKRADYINNWWNVVNWQRADEIYSEALGQ